MVSVACLKEANRVHLARIQAVLNRLTLIKHLCAIAKGIKGSYNPSVYMEGDHATLVTSTMSDV
jgi:hypothetical protein